MKEPMSYQEKQSIVSMVNTIIILGIYSYIIYSRYVADNPDIINDLSFWGKSFIILIPVTIVVQIVLHILFVIVNKIITNDEIPDKTDEMDKLIELKSIRISHWVFIVGFFLAMGSLALEMELWVMFVLLISFGFLAGIVSDMAKIYYYRKGL